MIAFVSHLQHARQSESQPESSAKKVDRQGLRLENSRKWEPDIDAGTDNVSASRTFTRGNRTMLTVRPPNLLFAHVPSFPLFPFRRPLHRIPRLLLPPPKTHTHEPPITRARSSSPRSLRKWGDERRQPQITVGGATKRNPVQT